MVYQLMKLSEVSYKGNFIIIKESNNLKSLISIMVQENIDYFDKYKSTFNRSKNLTETKPFLEEITTTDKNRRLTFPLEYKNYHFIRPKT